MLNSADGPVFPDPIAPPMITIASMHGLSSGNSVRYSATFVKHLHGTIRALEICIFQAHRWPRTTNARHSPLAQLAVPSRHDCYAPTPSLDMRDDCLMHPQHRFAPPRCHLAGVCMHVCMHKRVSQCVNVCVCVSSSPVPPFPAVSPQLAALLASRNPRGRIHRAPRDSTVAGESAAPRPPAPHGTRGA